jgi:phosphoribosylformylglycinamidine synthase
MISFFISEDNDAYCVQTNESLDHLTIEKLTWLFSGAKKSDKDSLDGIYIGPRATMITPWSTNAVEITLNMGIKDISRIERFEPFKGEYDPMLYEKYDHLDQSIFEINIPTEPIKFIENIEAYNISEGLSLSIEEVKYLEELSSKIGRKLTDTEVFGFSQVNSEHCRHKIFNGVYIIDGKEKEKTLFQLIKETSKRNPNTIISAYKDNVAFIDGPESIHFSPEKLEDSSYYHKKSFRSVISLKAETHNFPTTVEPFNGAATGSGGEIRDRLAGGLGSIPLAGTAVYMTPYSRLDEDRNWESNVPVRPWLYQNPTDILIKASNGASDFGNKFGQPLIAGSLFTFEHQENNEIQSFDKVIMLAGGIGYTSKNQAVKKKPKREDAIVILGGDNYRIGMGGAAVSSADTGAFGSGIELNAIQRSNPEMQKRVANVIRALVESENNPIISIHDHGAGGHLNCLSELVEENGGIIELDALPIGDSTLSFKEIIGNESQERMGLVIDPKDIELLRNICERERAPIYIVGKIGDDKKFIIRSDKTKETPLNLGIQDLFGNSPRMLIEDKHIHTTYQDPIEKLDDILLALRDVLRLESVACKDWLTNKVDRCVGGKVVKQQCCGELQLPLNNCGVMSLDYDTDHGIATSIGHSPISALIHPGAGSRNSVLEALTNIIWAPLEKGLDSVTLSANWMWPCKNVGEDARLYDAVDACAQFVIDLGINIPTGKDSLSMKQKYSDQEIKAPGTVIISAAAHCDDKTKVLEPVMKNSQGSLFYINISGDRPSLGGSAYYQTLNKVGSKCPDPRDATRIKTIFNIVQSLIRQGHIVAGHDVGSGGLITTLLEMCFPSVSCGAIIDLTTIKENSSDEEILFAENAVLVIQARSGSEEHILSALGNKYCHKIGTATKEPTLTIKLSDIKSIDIDIKTYRDIWYETSYLLDSKQTANGLAKERFENYKNQPLSFMFPSDFDGKIIGYNGPRPKAAILREKGSNSERELAHALFLAGFDVKDVHMTDLISGREDLRDIHFLGAVGGFSNSDVLGSAKGWAGSFRYNEKAKSTLSSFFDRQDTLSVGICNGCQLFIELGLIHPDHSEKPRMLHNQSHKHESIFTSVSIQKNRSVMLSGLEGCTLGVWVSHGEGKFSLPLEEDRYQIVAKYGYHSYPANPNGSDYNTAMMCSDDGRHLVMMPHIERSMFRWNWAFYDDSRADIISPWHLAFVNARKWLVETKK